MKTFKIKWNDGTTVKVCGTDEKDACRRAEISESALEMFMESMQEIIFVAIAEKPGESFVRAIGLQGNLVGDIDALRVGNRVNIASPTKIGVEIEIGGAEKMFVNGDHITRVYKAFALKLDAERWIGEQKSGAKILRFAALTHAL